MSFLDLNGVVLDTQEFMSTSGSVNGGVTVKYAGKRIHRIEILGTGGSGGAIDDLSFNTVTEPNKSPSISSFTATPKFGNPPLTINFNVTANDPDGSIAAYQWDFHGDGGIDDTTATGKTTHVYNDLGTFKASVTVVDNKGTKLKSSKIPITVQYGPDLVGEVESYRFDKGPTSCSNSRFDNMLTDIYPPSVVCSLVHLDSIFPTDQLRIL